MSKRILFLTPQLPYPPDRGTVLRNFGLIQGLSKRGHHLALLSFREYEQLSLAETPLGSICAPAITVDVPQRTRGQRLRDLLAGHADMARRLWSAEFPDQIERLLTRSTFDVIHIEGIEMAPYLPLLRQRAPGAMLIYDAHNAEYALQRRIALQDLQTPCCWVGALYSVIQAARLTRLETQVCREVDHVIACSETDAELLGKLRHPKPITVVPNAVWVESYQDLHPTAAPMAHPALVFTGKMDFRPNVDAVLWFAHEILPLIRRQVPDVRFVVVGQKPHARLDVLRDRPDVVLTGFVPDVRPYIRAADVYVAPLRMGSGTRFKLLEAMAMSRPIVSTWIGAEGIAAQDGRHLLLAADPEAFAQAVIGLLQDKARCLELGVKANELVREKYDWSAVIPRLEEVYEQKVWESLGPV